MALTQEAAIPQIRWIEAKPVPASLTTLFACLVVLVPTLTDAILLLRVATVYRPSVLPLRCAMAVYGPVAVFKVARATIDILFVVRWARSIVPDASPEGVLAAAEDAWRTPYPKVAWFLQLFDAAYVPLPSRRAPRALPARAPDVNRELRRRC